MENVEFAPFRSMDDFMLESARFQYTGFKDPERVVNRIFNNLLYYQTNYFIIAFTMFLLVGVMHPMQMMFGFAAVATAFTVFVYVTTNKFECRNFKRDHPGLCVGIILLGGYLLVYLMGSVIVFLFGIALPLLVILIHALLRKRNVKNRVANQVEFIGLKRTPMGLLLEGLGQEQEAGS